MSLLGRCVSLTGTPVKIVDLLFIMANFSDHASERLAWEVIASLVFVLAAAGMIEVNIRHQGILNVELAASRA